jgi:DNA mismatch repair protein MutS
MADSAPKKQNLTPMMRQYTEHKQRHPDAILLFRMGDFYEMFYEDAGKAAKILDIALTTRDKNKDESVPMCGFPHHSASAYISRLLAAGERVAVCDQMEDPRQAKGIVKRDVTRVLTPGLTEESDTISADEHHYVTALASRRDVIALASFDLSTGDLLLTETSEPALAGQELRRLAPKEILAPEALPGDHVIVRLLDDSMYVHRTDEWMSDPKGCTDALKEQFGVQNMEGFGFPDASACTIAAGTIIHYVRQSRPQAPTHIKPPRLYHLGNFMVLDQSTLRNLEIFRSTKDGSATGTLFKLLDRTKTSMGARLLRRWVSYPLLDPAEIRRRSESVEAFTHSAVLRQDVQDVLSRIGDLDRIVGKISLRSALPRDLVQLRESCEQIPALVRLIADIDTPAVQEIAGMDDLSYVAHAIASILVSSPPASMKDGGFIKSGYNDELDELRSLSTQGKEWIAGIEAQERQKTGIPNLKVGYNRVFGYYLEVTKTHQDKVPDHYIRKQTLVNAERYITDDLKEYELKILNAQERIVELEHEIFDLLRTKLVEVIGRIQQTSAAVATLDVFVCLADVAVTRRYVCPDVHDGDEITIVNGRHPVVETFEQLETYVPNDLRMSAASQQILVITGPNMAGKSTYMRQMALIVLMAQIGSFVPADETSIGIVDRIFTRIGAADYLAFGQSTFMVEMNETADILHNSTPRSLVLLDEVGRGTSTFDGLSIAWAVTEFLHDRPDGGPRTLFATHYHELVQLSESKERLRVYNVSVKEDGERIVFLRKIVPGGSSRSYGIQVARLAGIPYAVIERAASILANLENNELKPAEMPSEPTDSPVPRVPERKPIPVYQASLFGNPSEDLLQEIDKIDPNSMTPMEALTKLAEWKDRFGK